MKEKVVLITGANGLLGSSVTNLLLETGAMVVGASRSLNDKEIGHSNFAAKEADLSNGPAAQTLIGSTLKEFGRIDVLVHTIGSYAGGESIQNTDDKTFDQMMAVNLRTAFYVLRAVIPAMRRAATGRIIAIGSRSAVEPSPSAAVYGASKAALVSLLKSAAAENKNAGFTINAILPGTIDTPQNRAAMPNAEFAEWVSAGKIAETVLWLSSPAASDINGAMIEVYGKS